MRSLGKIRVNLYRRTPPSVWHEYSRRSSGMTTSRSYRINSGQWGRGKILGSPDAYAYTKYITTKHMRYAPMRAATGGLTSRTGGSINSAIKVRVVESASQARRFHSIGSRPKLEQLVDISDQASDFNSFQDRSPVLGTNYLEFNSLVPKTGLPFYRS